MAGMVLFIASEIMLFGGLFAAYFYVRTQAGSWPPSDAETRVGRELGAILTVILISSSVMAHFGILGLKRGNQTAFKVGIFLAIVLGTIFHVTMRFKRQKKVRHDSRNSALPTTSHSSCSASRPGHGPLLDSGHRRALRGSMWRPSVPRGRHRPKVDLNASHGRFVLPVPALRPASYAAMPP